MKGSNPKIVVVGSLVMDFVFRAGHRPKPGETLRGESFGLFLGGKGFNQAIGCKRLGADVTLVGHVGADLFGRRFMEKLRQEGMNTKFVMKDSQEGTGVACPVVFPDGQNSIIGVPRANMRLSVSEVDAAEDEIASADILLLQFEVNPEASEHASLVAQRHSTLVMLDPAPVHIGCEAFDWSVDYLVPNEVEANMLAEGDRPDEWARGLFTEPLKAVVITMGAAGALVFDKTGTREYPGYQVGNKDTTAAGDAFRAGLAVMLAQDKCVDEAVDFANACGALACTVFGAEPSIPDLSAVRAFMANHKPVPSEEHI